MINEDDRKKSFEIYITDMLRYNSGNASFPRWIDIIEERKEEPEEEYPTQEELKNRYNRTVRKNGSA